MAKEVITKETTTEEPMVHAHNSTCQCSPRSDNRLVIVAVGAAMVLFMIGLILGYLLGHNTAARNSSSSGMMNGDYRRFERGNLPMSQQRNTTNQNTSNSSNATPSQTQSQ